MKACRQSNQIWSFVLRMCQLRSALVLTPIQRSTNNCFKINWETAIWKFLEGDIYRRWGSWWIDNPSAITLGLFCAPVNQRIGSFHTFFASLARPATSICKVHIMMIKCQKDGQYLQSTHNVHQMDGQCFQSWWCILLPDGPWSLSIGWLWVSCYIVPLLWLLNSVNPHYFLHNSHYLLHSPNTCTTQWTNTTFGTIRTTCYMVPLLGLLSEPTLLAPFALLAQSTPLKLLTLVTLVRLVAQISVVTSNWGTWHCQGQKALSRTLITLGPCQTECRIACNQ